MKHLSLFVIATIISIVSYGQVAITGADGVCVGSASVYTDGVAGGIWSTSSAGVATIGSASGILTGVSVGPVVITYTVPPGSSVTKTVSINALPSAITGPSSVCVGGSITLADLSAGGMWSSANVVVATVSAAGVVSGVTAGVVSISYTYAASGCAVSHIVTVDPGPALYSVTGGGSYCAGGAGMPVGLSNSSAGVSYQLYLAAAAIGAPLAGTGSALSYGSQTAAGVYTVAGSTGSGCAATMTGSATIVVNALPSVTASTSAVGCDGSYTLTGGGATTYSWSPSAGLSCATCATTTINPTASTTFTVTGTSTATGCANTAITTADGNRIAGTISPTVGGTVRVWLVQFNPADSSITALDSMNACTSGGTMYYDFADPASGNYMVKAYELGGTPGTSGYVPTYSSSDANWSTAASVSHASATDVMNIAMIYGTVPSGPGFIGGLVASGAGKGTSGDAPVHGLLVYLRDAANHIVTYTYTDATGHYAFSGLANGSYTIYPELFQYTTTPSATVTLSAATTTVSTIDFKQHTTSHTITPFDYATSVKTLAGTQGITVYPNPASGNVSVLWQNQATGNADVVVTDVAGREVFKSVIKIGAAAGQAQLGLPSLENGIYIVTMKNQHINYSGKLVIAH